MRQPNHHRAWSPGQCNSTRSKGIRGCATSRMDLSSIRGCLHPRTTMRKNRTTRAAPALARSRSAKSGRAVACAPPTATHRATRNAPRAQVALERRKAPTIPARTRAPKWPTEPHYGCAPIAGECSGRFPYRNCRALPLPGRKTRTSTCGTGENPFSPHCSMISPLNEGVETKKRLLARVANS